MEYLGMGCIKMKKLYLTILVGILVLGLVSAGLGIGIFINENREISEELRNELLSQTDAVEINPTVNIKCSDNYCLWSANQTNIINSHNNKFSRNDMTDAEIQDYVADEVTKILEDYANVSIKRKADVVEDWGTGNVEITQRR